MGVALADGVLNLGVIGASCERQAGVGFFGHHMRIFSFSERSSDLSVIPSTVLWQSVGCQEVTSHRM